MVKKLFIPGPTEVRKEVLDAQAKPMIGHRMKDFSALYERTVNNLKKVLETQNHAMVFTSSATGVMEGALRNCVKRSVLACTNGSFSERWYKIAKACGKEADQLAVPWGTAVLPEMIDDKLKSGTYEAVTLVHNETSTGVRAPIEAIAPVMKKYPDVIWMVDTVSSLTGDKIEIDKLGIDVCIASVQKCFALPPGLAVCTVTPKALEKTTTIPDRGYYFDFVEMLKYWDERKQTPATPAVSLIYAMDLQLERMLAEGMANRYQRHRAMAEFVRGWGRQYFALYPAPGYESVTLTTVTNTRKISVADLNSELGKRGFAISNGYGKLKEETFRIAHMGDLTLAECQELITNINDILKL